MDQYLDKVAKDGLIERENLVFTITGHSRGGAVGNLLAHRLNQIRDGDLSGTHHDKFRNQVGAVYAYTFATPNVAAVSKIKEVSEEQNIHNFCYVNDFVPNLPLESWNWGKYGKTYWGNAANQYSSNSNFRGQINAYFGTEVSYSKYYTDTIVYGM